VKIRSFYLTRNENKCVSCGECTGMLPEFISKYGGQLIISEINYKQPCIRESVQVVINNCLGNAISIEVNDR